MEQEKKGKALALALALAVTALSPLGDCGMGIAAGCAAAPRLLHPLFHANVPHAALNAWALLSVAFTYGVTPRRLALAWLASSAFPAAVFGVQKPVAGLSGVVFFLFATLLFRVRRKMYFSAWMAAYLAAGFLLPGVGGWLHLWCFALGLAAAALNAPFKIKAKDGKGCR